MNGGISLLELCIIKSGRHAAVSVDAIYPKQVSFRTCGLSARCKISLEIQPVKLSGQIIQTYDSIP